MARLKIKGHVCCRVFDSNGKLKHKTEGDNLVVTTGKNTLAECILGTTTNKPSSMKMGSSGKIVDLAQTALLDPTSQDLDTDPFTLAQFDNIIRYSINYTATATKEIKEFGLYGGAGTVLIARWLPQTFIINPTNVIEVVWELSIG